MTEPSMVEKVARALHARKYGEWYEGPLKMTDSQRACLADARAAIEAMREPTDAMMEAIHTAMFVDKYDCTQAPMIGAGWEAGIDAALQKGKEGK